MTALINNTIENSTEQISKDTSPTLSNKLDFTTYFRKYERRLSQLTVEEQCEFTPDLKYKIYGFGDHAPDVYTIAYTSPQFNAPFTLRLQNHSVMTVASHLGFHFRNPQISANMHLIDWFHKIPMKAQQMRLSVQSSLSQVNPINLVNNAFLTTLTDILPLFQYKAIPDEQLDKTTYHYQSIFRTFLQNWPAAGVLRSYQTVGIHTLCRAIAQSPGSYMSGDELFVLWDRHITNGIEGQDDAFWMLQYTLNPEFPAPLRVTLVLTEEPNANYINQPAPAAWPAQPNATIMHNYLMRLSRMMSIEDLKMVLMTGNFNWAFMDPGGSWNINDTQYYVPKYNFFNHVLDYYAFRMENNQHVQVANIENHFSIEWINIVMNWMQLCYARRRCERFHISLFNQQHRSPSEVVVVLGDTWDQFSPPPTIWQLPYIPAYELLPQMTRISLLMKCYDWKPQLVMVWNGTVQVITHETTDGMENYIPCFQCQPNAFQIYRTPVANGNYLNVATTVNGAFSIIPFELLPAFDKIPISLDQNTSMLNKKNVFVVESSTGHPTLENTLAPDDASIFDSSQASFLGEIMAD